MTHENDATKKTACWKATILFLRGTLLLFSIIAMAWVHRDSAMILESKNHDYIYRRNIPMVPPHTLPKGMSRRINSAASSHRRAQAKQPPQARIVGGTSTEQNEYPYMVALNWDGMNDGKPICGGVLITPSIILTGMYVFVDESQYGRVLFSPTAKPHIVSFKCQAPISGDMICAKMMGWCIKNWTGPTGACTPITTTRHLTTT
jgi:hypothetical protein